MANSPPGRDTTENCRWTPIGVLSDPLKVTVLLLEYVLKEYVGGLAAEWHTYIEGNRSGGQGREAGRRGDRWPAQALLMSEGAGIRRFAASMAAVR